MRGSVPRRRSSLSDNPSPSESFCEPPLELEELEDELLLDDDELLDELDDELLLDDDELLDELDEELLLDDDELLDELDDELLLDDEELLDELDDELLEPPLLVTKSAMIASTR
ncbi:MAG: hypothetical protein KDD69_03165 [Bdellovibrionales bacterium]|nr:hypothetical protein [Bdellovibrionales bacterium]